MLPQNKINGMNIAWGRGKWSELEDGSYGYIFPEDDAFKIRLNPQTMEEMGVSEDDLFDCIAQIEAEFDAPKDHRLSFGLVPNQGYSHLGITVRSNLNDRVICVFTPTSIEDDSYDGYFEWYYDQRSGFDSLTGFLSNFDKATDGQHSNALLSPIMPAYGEAVEKTKYMSEEDQRETFLRCIWSYHKTSSIGHRRQLERDLLPKWKKICEEYDEKSIYHDYRNDLRHLSIENLKSVLRSLGQKMKAHHEHPVMNDDPYNYMDNVDLKVLRDKFELVKNELYKRSRQLVGA